MPGLTCRALAAAAAAVAVAAVGGCTGSATGATGRSPEPRVAGGSGTATAAASPTESSGTPEVAVATTPSGSKLKLGKPAMVVYTPSPAHTTVLKLTVDTVRQGSLNDLAGFRLSDAAKHSSVFYVSLTAKNTGQGTVGGPLQLYGRIARAVDVPPVILGKTLDTCPYQPLPWPFEPGDRVSLCMVMLAPHHGEVNAVQWRPVDDSKPISWTLRR